MFIKFGLNEFNDCAETMSWGGGLFPRLSIFLQKEICLKS